MTTIKSEAHIDAGTGKIPTGEVDGTPFATAAQGTKADGALQKSNNLSDLTSVASAQSNLGLGTAALQPVTAFDPIGAAASAQAAAQAASDPVGTAAVAVGALNISGGAGSLAAGTVTISANITNTSKIIATVKDANPGLGNLTIMLAIPAGSRTVGTSVSPGTFVVRANIAAGTINVLDTSTFDWVVIG